MATMDCCDAHVAGRAGNCCDPEDCAPCCNECPTCPTVHRVRPALARSAERDRRPRR